MTETPHPWDRLPTETDPAFEAFALYLEHGSLMASWRQHSGNKKAINVPGGWTNWSRQNDWVKRRAAYVDATIRECQESLQAGLVQLRRRFVDEAAKLLDEDDLSAKRLSSDIIKAHFPPVAVSEVSQKIDLTGTEGLTKEELQDCIRDGEE